VTIDLIQRQIEGGSLGWDLIPTHFQTNFIQMIVDNKLNLFIKVYEQRQASKNGSNLPLSSR